MLLKIEEKPNEMITINAKTKMTMYSLSLGIDSYPQLIALAITNLMK